MKTILFIAHDVSRTGAPYVLLLFLQWLRKHHQGISIHLTSLRGGELEPDFQKTVHVYTRKPEKRLRDRIKNKFFRNGGSNHFSGAYLKKLNNKPYDIIYANTVASLPLAQKLKCLQPNTRIILHLHEMPTVIKLLCPDFKALSYVAERIICPSELVAETVRNEFGIIPGLMEVVYEFTRQLKVQEKGIKSEDFNVAACGTFHWRKGGDIFLQVARYVKNKNPKVPVHFTWIGKVPENEKLIIEADLEKMGISDIISFTGVVDNPEEILNEMDVFLLTSREDPFPLAAIEAGTMGIPIICFQKASGTAEFIKKGGGFVVPYLDINSMAAKIILYQENKDLLKEHSKEVIDLFGNLTLEKQSTLIFEILNS